MKIIERVSKDGNTEYLNEYFTEAFVMQIFRYRCCERIS